MQDGQEMSNFPHVINVSAVMTSKEGGIAFLPTDCPFRQAAHVLLQIDTQVSVGGFLV